MESRINDTCDLNVKVQGISDITIVRWERFSLKPHETLAELALKFRVVEAACSMGPGLMSHYRAVPNFWP